MLGNYELCHVDVSTEYGQQVAKAFGATQFPHTAIIDRTGAVVLFKKPGQIAETEWTAALTRYQSGEQTTARTVSYRGSVLPAGYRPTSNGVVLPLVPTGGDGPVSGKRLVRELTQTRPGLRLGPRFFRRLPRRRHAGTRG